MDARVLIEIELMAWPLLQEPHCLCPMWCTRTSLRPSGCVIRQNWCSQGGYSRARPRPTLTHPLAPRRLSGGRASGSPALRYQRVTLKVCRGVLRWCALLAQRAAPHAREAGARAAVPAFFAGQWSRQGRFLALRVCSEGVGPFTHRTVHLRISTPRTRHRTESPPDQ